MRFQLSKVYYLTVKDIKAYFTKPPLLTWGILFPAVMILAFYLKNPQGIKELAGGLIAMTILFGATSVEAIVLTFERRVGTLDRLLAAPLSLGEVIMGKALSGALFGLAVGFVVLVISRLFLGVGVQNFSLLALTMCLSAVAFAFLGTLVSVAVREVFEAMTLSNFFRFPMIFLSGVFIPLESMPPYLKAVAYFLPLTYSVDSMRWCLGGEGHISGIYLDSLALVGFIAALSILSERLFRKRLQESWGG